REQRRTDPASGPGARFGADRAPGGGVQFAGPLYEALFERRDGIRIGTLLRPEDSGRSPRAQQWVLDVTGRNQIDPREPSPRGVQAAELLDEPAATVGTRAATQSDHDADPPRLQRRSDQPADSPAVRRERSGRCRRAAE